jgi:hypothetical protein
LHFFGTRHGGTKVPDMHDMTITEIVASILAVMSVGAIIWLAVADQSASAQTALTGLVGAASSFFLTPKLTNGKKPPEPPAP